MSVHTWATHIYYENYLYMCTGRLLQRDSFHDHFNSAISETMFIIVRTMEQITACPNIRAVQHAEEWKALVRKHIKGSQRRGFENKTQVILFLFQEQKFLGADLWKDKEKENL